MENGDHTEEVTDDDNVLDSVDDVLEEKCPEKDLIQKTDQHEQDTSPPSLTNSEEEEKDSEENEKFRPKHKSDSNIIV